MKRVIIVACENAWGTSIMGPKDFFTMANLVCAAANKELPPEQPYFDIKIITIDGKPVRCGNDSILHPDLSMDEVHDSDLVILPAVFGGKLLGALEQTISLCAWIRKQYAQGSILASMTTGAFMLAEAGLLDDKPATTHWAFSKLFKRRYPKVLFHADRMITDAGNLYCTAGLNAWITLLSFLLEKYYGPDIAWKCSLFTRLDNPFSQQTPFIGFAGQKFHQDNTILTIQQWLEENHDSKIHLEKLASDHGLSLRNFKRRFKAATGEPPLHYLHRLRIERAKHLLESTELTVQEICYRVGYEDSSLLVNYSKDTHQVPQIPIEKSPRFFLACEVLPHALWSEPRRVPACPPKCIHDELEKLCRYFSRPAVSEKRLALTSNGKVRYQLKTP